MSYNLKIYLKYFLSCFIFWPIMYLYKFYINGVPFDFSARNLLEQLVFMILFGFLGLFIETRFSK